MSEVNGDIDRCPNCSAVLSGKYCSVCGEKKFSHHDLSLAHFLEEALDLFTHFDTRFFRSFKTVLVKPGEMTVDFLHGKRQPYMKPLQFFLIVNVIYFLVIASGFGFNTFTTPLKIHLGQHHFYRDWAKAKVDHQLAVKKITYEAYEEAFDHKTNLLSKSLIIVFIPVYALLFQFFFIHKKRYFTEHIITATHFMTFFMLLLMLIVPLFVLIFSLIKRVFPELGAYIMSDNFISIIITIIVGMYLFRMFRRVYVTANWYGLALAVLISLNFYGLIWLYRGLLFFVTYQNV
ncbi:hypothetical protein BH11BAC2_BH11BAC2_03930 [soil metagenome]